MLLMCSICSQLVTPFQVDFAEPFKVEPQDGTLQPYSSLKLTASFQPKVTRSTSRWTRNLSSHTTCSPTLQTPLIALVHATNSNCSSQRVIVSENRQIKRRKLLANQRHSYLHRVISTKVYQLIKIVQDQNAWWWDTTYSVIWNIFIIWFLTFTCCIFYVHLWLIVNCLQCFDAVGWAAGRASGLQKAECWDAGVVICLGQDADVHMALLMPLPLTVSCFSKTQIGFTFLVLAHLGNPKQSPEGHKVDVCVLWFIVNNNNNNLGTTEKTGCDGMGMCCKKKTMKIKLLLLLAGGNCIWMWVDFLLRRRLWQSCYYTTNCFRFFLFFAVCFSFCDSLLAQGSTSLKDY